MDQQQFDTWAIVELMGHRRLAGFVSEAEIAGNKLLRIDVPESTTLGDPAMRVTQYYNTGSLYCLTPTTEEIARAVAVRNRPQPVQPYELRQLQPPAPAGPLYPDGAYNDDEG